MTRQPMTRREFAQRVIGGIAALAGATALRRRARGQMIEVTKRILVVDDPWGPMPWPESIPHGAIVLSGSGACRVTHRDGIEFWELA